MKPHFEDMCELEGVDMKDIINGLREIEQKDPKYPRVLLILPKEAKCLLVALEIASE